ncbi:hypothetical protein [Stenotrophomonas pavanii]|uniref:hypothetical protein n=1 Tax=Stenotrophomonas pavanii TaxID=487698 RepID=UPI0039C5C6B1
MSMLDGVTQCWVLGPDCLADWDAWSAVGTIVAAVVALALGVAALLSQWRMDKKREKVAQGLLRELGERLFDEIEAIGSNYGVADGAWDATAVHFVIASADKLKAISISAEPLLLSLGGEGMSEWTIIVGRARGISEDALSLQKHSQAGQIEVAEYVTQSFYGEAKAMLAREERAMSAIGGKALRGRALPEQRERSPAPGSVPPPKV